METTPRDKGETFRHEATRAPVLGEVSTFHDVLRVTKKRCAKTITKKSCTKEPGCKYEDGDCVLDPDYDVEDEGGGDGEDGIGGGDDGEDDEGKDDGEDNVGGSEDDGVNNGYGGDGGNGDGDSDGDDGSDDGGNDGSDDECDLKSQEECEESAACQFHESSGSCHLGAAHYCPTIEKKKRCIKEIDCLYQDGECVAAPPTPAPPPADPCNDKATKKSCTKDPVCQYHNPSEICHTRPKTTTTEVTETVATTNEKLATITTISITTTTTTTVETTMEIITEIADEAGTANAEERTVIVDAAVAEASMCTDSILEGFTTCRWSLREPDGQRCGSDCDAAGCSAMACRGGGAGDGGDGR